jgi:hypothetical protein
MEWTAIAIFLGLLVNAVVVAFGYGILTQRVKNLETQGVKTTDTADRDRNNTARNLAVSLHTVLPECNNTFNLLREGQAEIKGMLKVFTKGKSGE